MQSGTFALTILIGLTLGLACAPQKSKQSDTDKSKLKLEDTGNQAICSSQPWEKAKPYGAGTLVKQSGVVFRALRDNPGYDPYLSYYYWERVASCVNVASGDTQNRGAYCTGERWVAGKAYAAGQEATYNSGIFVAINANAGSNPAEDTANWDHVSNCEDQPVVSIGDPILAPATAE